MATFEIPDKDLETTIDRSADSFLIYDDSASKLVRTNVISALGITGDPVGTSDSQILTNKTIPAYEPVKGADDNYVTAAEKIVIGNTSGTNTGDQTLPVKASGAEVDTGEDDAKFLTAKAVNDSHNVPDVAPGTAGNLLQSNGTDWTSISTPLSTAYGGTGKSDGTNLIDSFNGTATRILFQSTTGGQGLASDGTYFYWGNSLGAGTNGEIKKMTAVGTVVDTFVAPPHAAGGEYSFIRGTLFFSSGDTEDAVVWEINTTTGAKIREWDFTTLGYGEGNLVTCSDVTGNVIYLFSCNVATNAFDIYKVQINDDGTWSELYHEVDNHASLGVAQGLAYKNGYLYYLTDTPSATTRSITQFSTSTIALTPSLQNTWIFDTPDESEGLTFHNGVLVYGDATHTVRMAIYPPYAPLLRGRSLDIAGPGLENGEIIAHLENTSGGHTGIQLLSAKDSYVAFGDSAIADGTNKSKFDIRYDQGTGNLQFRTQDDNTVRMYITAAGETHITDLIAKDGSSHTTIGANEYRATRFVPLAAPNRIVTADPADTGWVDVDCTGITSANCFAVTGTCGIQGASAGKYLNMRANGDTSTGTQMIRCAVQVATVYNFAGFTVGVDTGQIFEYSVTNADVTKVEIFITGYWEYVD